MIRLFENVIMCKYNYLRLSCDIDGSETLMGINSRKDNSEQLYIVTLDQCKFVSNIFVVEGLITNCIYGVVVAMIVVKLTVSDYTNLDCGIYLSRIFT